MPLSRLQEATVPGEVRVWWRKISNRKKNVGGDSQNHPKPQCCWMKSYCQRVPLTVSIMTANVFLILHLVLSIFPIFGCYSLAFLSFSDILPASFWILFSQMCFMLRSPSTQDYSCCSVTPWFIISAERLLSCICFFLGGDDSFVLGCLDVVSDTLSAVGCLRANCWSGLVTKLSPASTSSCVHGCGWGKISRMYNVLRGNLHHIWQHYPVDGCQEYEWHNFLGSFSDRRCKFDMGSGKQIFQKNFKEEFIPHIAILQVFTLLNWTPAIFTISL